MLDVNVKRKIMKGLDREAGEIHKKWGMALTQFTSTPVAQRSREKLNDLQRGYHDSVGEMARLLLKFQMLFNKDEGFPTPD